MKRDTFNNFFDDDKLFFFKMRNAINLLQTKVVESEIKKNKHAGESFIKISSQKSDKS